MKLKGAFFAGCLSVLMSGTVFASCGSCNDEWSCNGMPNTYCGAPGPGTSCSCTDPACREENPCLSPSRCCEAFGNISGIEGFPND